MGETEVSSLLVGNAVDGEPVGGQGEGAVLRGRRGEGRAAMFVDAAAVGGGGDLGAIDPEGAEGDVEEGPLVGLGALAGAAAGEGAAGDEDHALGGGRLRRGGHDAGRQRFLAEGRFRGGTGEEGRDQEGEEKRQGGGEQRHGLRGKKRCWRGGEAEGYRGERGACDKTGMHAIWWMLTALAVLALGYRYYSAFIAAKVLALDDARRMPSHELRDGQNYHPTNRWVLFGHHFAAISGAGPLIGPVLAAQFGFLPGYLWLLFGVVLAGAVQDFVILVGSVRHRGRSLAEIAHEELGPFLGFLTGLSILFIVVVALAGLGKVVVEALAESSWGVFTIGASIPIALGMGLYIYKVRGGSDRGIKEASAGGVILLLLALVAGKYVQDSAVGEVFRLSRTSLTVAIAGYGFVASVLPVWMLLCPRDYLSSYLKIGTIALLVLGILLVNPMIEMPIDRKSVV